MSDANKGMEDRSQKADRSVFPERYWFSKGRQRLSQEGVTRARRRVMLVAMADSVHVAKWLDSIAELPLDVLLVPSSPNRRVHSGIRKFLRGFNTNGLKVTIPLVSRLFSVPIWVLDSPGLFSGRIRGAIIAYFAWRTKPERIHLMESQNAGYSYLRARLFSRKILSTPTSLTLFGSDLFWFSQFPKHSAKLSKLLASAGALATEGKRDQDLATTLGFKGNFFTSMPVSGGIAEHEIFDGSPEDVVGRQSIAVKGYSNSLGVGENALKALARLLPEQSRNWRVEVFSAEGKSIKYARDLRKQGHDVIIYKKHQLSHGEVLDLLRRSRVFIGLSRSDGLPASFLEAMSQGAFPIQSNSSVASDWVESGVSGILVDYHAIDEIAKAINIALSDDNLVIEAAKSNLATIQSRAANSKLRQILQREFGEFVGVEAITG